MPSADTFMVDLAALHRAIGQVSSERDSIRSGLARVRSTFTNVEDHWQGPSGTSFVGLAANFNSAADGLMAVLDEAIGRMRAAYDTYSATEATNTHNLQ